MKILVTGGAGFIGSNFIKLLLNERTDIEVINFDCLTYAGNLDNLAEVERFANYRFIRGNICDAQAVCEAMSSGVEAVINFAAESHVDRSIYSPNEFVQTNVLGVQVLLNAAIEFKVGRFVQISTDEVMGSLEAGEFFTEDSPLRPNSPYAASKSAAEHLARAANRTFGLDTVIIRSSNAYGPYQFPEKLIPLMISNAIKDEPLPVYGDGLNERDWIYVEDLCRAIEAVLFHGRGGEIYNIGARTVKTNIEVVRLLLKILGKPDSLIVFVKDRPGHDRRYATDPGKIERELGWGPRQQFEAGLSKTVDWYLNNSEWVERARSRQFQEFYQLNYSSRGLESPRHRIPSGRD